VTGRGGGGIIQPVIQLLRRARLPEPSHLSVLHEGETFRLRVRRSANARRFTLRVSAATGEVSLGVPARASLKAALAFAQGHGGWIAARLARRPERVAFEPSALVPLRGVPHRIVHDETARGVAALTDGEERVLRVGCGPRGIDAALRAFLKREARRDLAAAAALHAGRLGRPVAGIALKDTRSRWGSCSAAGRLNFSWRLVMAPPSVLDYLAAHEAAHLVEMNHSVRFWRVVEGLRPDFREAEAWLRREGAGLHRYG